MLLGQSVEYKIASMLLAEARDIYLPVVDDHGVDILVAPKNPANGYQKLPLKNTANVYQELQIKSISKGGLFAAISCNNPRPNYWFVFHLLNVAGTGQSLTWLINSMDFVKIASQNKQGKNIGKYSLTLATKGGKIHHQQFLITDFNALP